MNNILLFSTFLGLIIFFAFLEIYKYKFYVKGKVVGFHNSQLGLDSLIISYLDVRLENGTTVKAEAERCTMCMGQFTIGDEVRLIKSQNRYMVHLPLTYRKKQACNVN